MVITAATPMIHAEHRQCRAHFVAAERLEGDPENHE